jgi:Leucine-rich repeat (LRR) protein
MQQLQFTCKNYSSRLPIPLLGFAALLLISLATPTSSCTEQEKNSLLQFLSELSQDAGLAKLWKEDRDCCSWEGISCNRNKTVIEISLASRGLEGHISQSLGNLTGLQQVNLSYNSLSGGLPLGLVSSSSIIVLDVSFNQLTGELHEPTSSVPGQPLQVLNISSNLFSGQFTSTTWKGMQNLIALNASNNSFTGQIPSHFCNISPSFSVLELCYNKLSGSIPPGLGNCSKLRVLKAGHNYLSGTLPEELFKATLLEHLSFSSNGLQGILDSTHIVKLGKMAILDLGENKFSGMIPDSIGQLTRLQELHLDYNSMSGELPSTLSSCTNLITLDLKSNNFSGEINKVGFSNFPNLKTLDLMWNNFSGTIPESIYSCRNLIALRLSSNKFHGELSKGLGNLKSLSFLSLTNNSFSNLTNTLQILRSSDNLTTLLLGMNFMNETMPDNARFDGFESLRFLAIENCLLSGEIPFWISKLANLELLILQGNQLSGPIPAWINTLEYLFYLDISNNSLTGEIPTTLMKMPMLTSEKTAAHLDPRIFDLPVYEGQSRQYRIPIAFPKVLDLSTNKFTGVIPPDIGQLIALLSLDISFNNLTGPIPPSICNLTNLQMLDLSNNNLTGKIPAALENLHFLSAFNVSNNNLEGPIPTGRQFNTFQNSSFDGNPKLCGSMLVHRCNSAQAPPVSLRKRNKKQIFAIAFGVFFAGIAILLLLGRLLVLIRVNSLTSKNRRGHNQDIETTSINSSSEHELIMMPHGNSNEKKLTFSDIVTATNNFDKEHIIGCGGYGLVYKAELPDGCKLAIKKLNDDMCLMEREFTAEVEALSMAQHDHLVPLRGYCIQGNSRFLIYSFMENGSLDDWLHNRDDDASTFLDWPTRLRIAKGACYGLSYIHNTCKPHIVHRDIKSSNILLDKELKAYVADFGLSRLILPNKTHVTTELVGTLGYIPPEYAHGWVATLRGDIYSLGVVLLELLTGLRPVPVLSTSKELVPWVLEMRSQGKQTEVLDPTLRGTGHEEQMLKVLEIACKCVNYNSSMRPPITEVVSCLESINTGLQTQKSVTMQLTREYCS